MKLPIVLTLFSLAALAPAFAETPAEALQLRGGKLREEKGVLVELTVDVKDFGPAEYRLIGQCTKLRKLTLNGNTLTDSTLPLLAGLTELEELSTNQSALTDDGYRHFAPLKKLRSLALFHPSWDSKQFTGTGLVHLKALPSLERLTFAGSTAGDTAMEAVGQITQLRNFSTWHTAQTQAGNAHLLKLTNLTSLRIGQRLPKWGTDSAPSLDAKTITIVAQMNSLEALELFEARLTADALAPLKSLPKLTRLTIHTTDIPAADVESLRAALPGVKLDYKPITEADREATLVKKLRL